MDTSKEYIAMCATDEIQADHKWEDGDYQFIPYNEVVNVYCEECEHEFGPFGGKPQWIWLPRVDQLIDMTGYTCPVHALLMIVGNWARRFTHSYQDQIFFDTASPERTFLAYVMGSKYGKEWSAKRWRKFTGKEDE